MNEKVWLILKPKPVALPGLPWCWRGLGAWPGLLPVCRVTLGRHPVRSAPRFPCLWNEEVALDDYLFAVPRMSPGARADWIPAFPLGLSSGWTGGALERGAGWQGRVGWSLCCVFPLEPLRLAGRGSHPGFVPRRSPLWAATPKTQPPAQLPRG